MKDSDEIFSEVSDTDVTLTGGQGFGFDAKEHNFYKLVKITGVTHPPGYEAVVRVGGMPVSKTPNGTPSSSAQKRTPQTGRTYVELFEPASGYNIKAHHVDTWSVYGDTPTSQNSKMVR